ncbi:MAG: hypothetical protein JXN61_16095 [Sedimentisphaerales bacterium]|nr:hypothetical protein [Sedimentisphaerales bacterium]
MRKKKFTIEPPPRESGPERLYRVVYIIDVNAADPKEAAGFTHQIMTDPDSLPPVLHVIDEVGKSVKIDLSKED